MSILCIAICYHIAMIFLIIGVPTYMFGCDETLGGYCAGFTRRSSTVIYNTCSDAKQSDDETPTKHGIQYNHHSNGDCNVYVQYYINNVSSTCTLKRSDHDRCASDSDDVDPYKCRHLNNRDYPINSTVPLWISKYDGTCESHHYVSRIAIIGFSFLVMSGIMIFFLFIQLIVNRMNVKKSVNIGVSINEYETTGVVTI